MGATILWNSLVLKITKIALFDITPTMCSGFLAPMTNNIR